MLSLLAMAVGCSAAPERGVPESPTPTWLEMEAQEAFEALEARLLHGAMDPLSFEVTAEGAFEVQLSGRLDAHGGNGARLEAEGIFGGAPQSLHLAVREDRMVGGSQQEHFDEPLAPALHEALVVGLTRMGILHNLARLVGGVPPDRAGGGVQAWVEVRAHAWRDPELPDAIRGIPEVARGIAFEIWVEGQPAGEAVLWLRADQGLWGRDQVVRFPGGEMTVRERYGGR